MTFRGRRVMSLGVALAVAAAGGGGGVAEAQCAAALPGPPLLHVSATGRTKVAPDELVADMVALAVASSPVAAQKRVNTMMADAAAAARQVPGVHAAFQAYSVALTDEKQQRWTAQQTLELRAEGADALLDLVARLQSGGLAIGSLDWQVSEARQQAAHDTATTAALEALRQRADLAARALGMEVDHVQDVRLDQGPVPMPMLRRMSAAPMAASSMPAPNATPEAQEIGAQVSADIVLRPGH